MKAKEVSQLDEIDIDDNTLVPVYSNKIGLGKVTLQKLIDLFKIKLGSVTAKIFSIDHDREPSVTVTSNEVAGVQKIDFSFNIPKGKDGNVLYSGTEYSETGSLVDGIPSGLFASPDNYNIGDFYLNTDTCRLYEFKYFKSGKYYWSYVCTVKGNIDHIEPPAEIDVTEGAGNTYSIIGGDGKKVGEFTVYNGGNGIVIDDSLNADSPHVIQNQAIAKLVPPEASAENQLADKNYVVENGIRKFSDIYSVPHDYVGVFIYTGDNTDYTYEETGTKYVAPGYGSTPTTTIKLETNCLYNIVSHGERGTQYGSIVYQRTMYKMSDVKKEISDALADITKFDISVVDSLPSKGVKGTVYFVPQESAEDDNKYLEYLWVNEKFEQVGSKTIDLSNYVKTDDSRLSDARTPTAHNQASNTITAMTEYSKPGSSSAIEATDSLNSAIGKLEKALDSKGTSSFSGDYNDLSNKPSMFTAPNGFFSSSFNSGAKSFKPTTGTISDALIQIRFPALSGTHNMLSFKVRITEYDSPCAVCEIVVKLYMGYNAWHTFSGYLESANAEYDNMVIWAGQGHDGVQTILIGKGWDWGSWNHPQVDVYDVSIGYTHLYDILSTCEVTVTHDINWAAEDIRANIPKVRASSADSATNANHSSTAGHADSAGWADESVKLKIQGYGVSGLTFYQTPDSLQNAPNDWASYIICNHGDGSSYYNQIIRMPFWGSPSYSRKEGGTNTPWYNFVTTENINIIPAHKIRTSEPSSPEDGDIWIG